MMVVRRRGSVWLSHYDCTCRTGHCLFPAALAASTTEERLPNLGAYQLVRIDGHAAWLPSLTYTLCLTGEHKLFFRIALLPWRRLSLPSALASPIVCALPQLHCPFSLSYTRR